MKIGLISINMYSKGLNFACPLHTYAFQQFLLANGVESTVIDYKPIYFDNFNMLHPSDYYKALYDKRAAASPATPEARAVREEKMRYYKKKMAAWEDMRHEREVRYEKVQRFIEENYIKTPVCYDSDLLEIEDPGFDCYICVTDVIWKNQPDFGFDRGFFLGSTCMEQKWKFAYSASRGAYVAKNDAEREQFFRYLNDMDAISVREKSLKQYLEENSSLKVAHVLDPVLMNGPEFYDRIAVKPEEEHYLLLYYVMERAMDTIRQAVAYARKHHLKIIEITDNPVKDGKLKKYSNLDYTFRYDIGIGEWIGYIKHADCIFTNSFHGCCLSVIYEKDFYVGFRKSDKVTDFLETFRLLDRYLPNIALKKEDDSLSAQVRNRLLKYAKRCFPRAFAQEKPINYGPIRTILKRRRKESADFILGAIRQAEAGERPHRDYDACKKALRYPLYYNSRLKNKPFSWTYDEAGGTVQKMDSGSYEYQAFDASVTNDGTHCFAANGFVLGGFRFRGWNVRLRIDRRWFWYLENGRLVLKDDYSRKKHGRIRLFADGETIPYIPVNHIAVMIAEAVWEHPKAKSNTPQ